MKTLSIVLTTISVVLVLLGSCKKDDDSISIPAVSTIRAEVISQTQAWVDGEILNNGGETDIISGICWSTEHEPSLTDNTVEYNTEEEHFSYQIKNLDPGTTYYVRAYATNSKGTGYGEVFSIKTLEELVDIEGNTYHTVIIGSQEWMSENLKTTTYNDGTPIAYITDNEQWYELTSGAYTWYNNDMDSYKDSYGALYNWYAVSTNKLCPAGWRVSTDEDWFILLHFVGPWPGNKLKSTRVEPADHPRWNLEGYSGTDEYGFSALPAGYRYWYWKPDYYQNDLDVFGGLGWYANWWTSTEFTEINAISFNTKSNWSEVARINYTDKGFGYTVRCVRD